MGVGVRENSKRQGKSCQLLGSSCCRKPGSRNSLGVGIVGGGLEGRTVQELE